MASVKKTMKSSETKQAKKPGIRSPKAKASQTIRRIPKPRNHVASAALAAKQLAAKQSRCQEGRAQKAKVQDDSAKAQKPNPPPRRRRPRPRTPERGHGHTGGQEQEEDIDQGNTRIRRLRARPAQKDRCCRHGVKTGPAARNRRQTHRGTPKAAGGRSSKPCEQVGSRDEKTPALKVSRGKAAKPAAAARAVDAEVAKLAMPYRKLAAGKEAAAALLAFKRNVARLSEIPQTGTPRPLQSQPAVTHFEPVS